MPDCTTSVLFFFVNPTGKPTDNEVGWVAKPAWTWWLKEKNCQRIILFKLRYVPISFGGTWWRSWLRHCATRRKAAGSIPDDVIGIFHWHNPSGHTVALGLTQPLTEMSTRNTSWGVMAAGAYGWQLCHLHVPDFLGIWEPQTPGTLRAVQACNGIALPLPVTF